jgi:hypothetical protein
MDFTQPRHNYFAQALAFDVGDLISIVIVSFALDATQWQVALDIGYQFIIFNNIWRLEDLPPTTTYCAFLQKAKHKT